MKKRILSAIAVFMLVSFVSIAQKQNVIKVNLLSPLVKTYNLQYERALGESKSFQLGVFYTGAKAGDVSLTGIGITPEYRMYLSEKSAPAGFFLAPFVRYQNFTLTTDIADFSTGAISEGKASLTSFRPGLLVGYQWLFSDKVSFEMFFGPAYSINSVKVKSDVGAEDDFSASALDGFGLRSGITLGIAF